MIKIDNQNCIIIFQTLIIFIQTYIIWKQLSLSNRINRNNLKKEKGYFVLDITDIGNSESNDRLAANGKYSLTNKLDFLPTGIEDIFIVGYEYYINNVKKKSNTMPDIAFFSKNTLLNKYCLEFELNKKERLLDKVEFRIYLYLKNSSDFEYQEEITLEFSKVNNLNYYIVTKYSINFIY